VSISPLPFVITELTSECGVYRLRRGRLGWVAARRTGNAWDELGDSLPGPEEAKQACADDRAEELALTPADISF
jgi:hypothetical protein